MQREVFLEENRSKLSVNSESNVAVNLTGKQRLLPFDSAAETMSLYELYNTQRDNCEKYRLIFNVNPFCTNVLFNAITEPVWKEGSDSAISLLYEPIQVSERPDVFPNGTINTTETVDKEQAVKDTEYSHPDIGGIVYHCGYDIFNNHLLRSEDFLHAQKSSENVDKFNTIEDYMVDNEGKVVEERGGRSFRHLGYVKRHMYQYDNCLSMPMAYLTKISEENGWYGFTNIGYIDIPNAVLGRKEISVNRVMNNNKPCEFYDMYPDRSLFSFIPKVNKWRKRLEKNWDYCITYPAESDTAAFNALNDTPPIPDSDRRLNALVVLKTDLKYTNNGIKLVRFKTLFDHGLSKGNYVRIYYVKDGVLTRYYKKVRVQQVGDYEGYDMNRYFSVGYDDIADIIPISTETAEDGRPVDFVDLPDGFKIFIRQESNGSEFNYYLRKFKKYRDLDEKEPRSEINKTAYQETIYGDRAVQIIYTDDVDVAGLVDNLGRPVTTLYLTIVKRNKGHEKWYDEKIVKDEDIEFSHCFGKVTSGFDFGNDTLDYNIRKMHNIEGIDAPTVEMLGWVGASGVPAVVEDDITIEGTYVNDEFREDEFYGDVACYDTYNLVEHIIMPLYHRFNTAQRETLTEEYRDIKSDEIDRDDFDYMESENTQGDIDDDGKKDPQIDARPDKDTVPHHGTGNELKSVIKVTSEPGPHEGTLKLRSIYPDINIEKTGEDEYTVTFSDNNTESARTVYAYGTLSTPPDTGYKGTTAKTFDFPITQGEKEFPIGYEIVSLTIQDKVIPFGGQTTAAVKINKVRYINYGISGKENVKEVIEEDIDPTGILQLEWVPENDQRCLGLEPNGKTVQCINNNTGKTDIDNVNLFAYIPNSSGAVYGILLKGEDEVKYVYKLVVSPLEATATTLNPAVYEAVLEKYESGSTIPISTQVVSTTSTWELLDDPDQVNDYARMVQNTVVKKSDVEPDGNIRGKVKVTCIDGNGEELSNEEDIYVTIVPDYDEHITINFTNVATTQDTTVVFSVTQRGSTHSSEANGKQGRTVTIPKGRNSVSEEFLFQREEGEATEYTIQITSCVGNVSNVSYSEISGIITNWSQLNQQYLKNRWFSKSIIDGSEFIFDGLKTTIKIDTREAGDAFESFGVAVDGAMEVNTSQNTLLTSNEFYIYDLGDTFTARIDGGVIEKDASLYTLEIKNSIGTTLRNGTLESFRLGAGSNFGVEGMTPNSFTNTTWILGKGKALYSLVVCATTSETIEWNGEEQYRAFLVKTEGGQVYPPENVTTASTWYLTGDVKTNIAATIFGTGPNAGKVVGRNSSPRAISGQVCAKYTNTEIDPDTAIILTGTGNITVLGKELERMVTATLQPTAKVRINIGTEQSLKGKTMQMTITSPDCEGSISFSFAIPANATQTDVTVKNITSNTMRYTTSNTGSHTIGMNMTYAIQSMANVNIKSVGPWSTMFSFNEEISNSGDFEFEGNISASNTDITINIDGVFMEFNVNSGNLMGAKMMRAVDDELVFGATTQGTVKEFNRSMLTQKDEGHFEISSTTLNLVDGDGAVFYGNLNPEGYFYNPHTPIKIRQLSDEIYSTDGIVIGFDSGYVSTGSEVVETYDPDTQEIKSGVTVYTLSATSPVNMDFVEGMEFIIYNKENGDGTKVGRLLSYDDKFSGGGCLISLWVNAKDQAEMDELANGLKNKKYMLVLKKEYAPRYAIFQPKLRQFIWREVVPQSELRYDDELYDMTFANGRFYIHTNMNFYCRRQDPQNIYGLQSPETDKYNPLKKFRIGGREKVDTTDIIYSPDNLIDCF